MIEENNEESISPVVKEYLDVVTQYDQLTDYWKKLCRRIEKIYRNKPDFHTDEANKSRNRYNIFWNNVQTLKPTFYARTPKPFVDRSFMQDDQMARLIAEIRERVSKYLIKTTSYHRVMLQVRDDFILFSRGTAWVEFERKYSDQVIGQDEQGQPIFDVETETVKPVYVSRDKFIHDCSSTWEDVTTIGRKHLFTRAEVKEKFGDEVAGSLKYNKTIDQNDEDPKQKAKKKGKYTEILEFCDKEKKKVFYISPENKTQPLKEIDDPYNLRNFYPCPRPLYGDILNESLEPIPDFVQYQDLFEEINNSMLKRKGLLKAIKVKAIANGASPELMDFLDDDDENIITPVQRWRQVVEAGGLRGAIDFHDISPYVQAIQVMDQTIATQEARVDRISSIPDIVRGQSVASETATAQQIKGNFATLRIQDKQQEVQRFAADLLDIMTELAVEKFTSQTIANIIQLESMKSEDQQAFEQALSILRDSKQTDYKIMIETDSMVYLDEQQEKQKRNEFLTAVPQMLQTFMGMLQTAPEMAQIALDMLMFGVRGYKVGRELEYSIESSGRGMIEKMKAAMEQQSQQQEPPPPDPRIELEQAKLSLASQDSQVKQAIESEKLNLKQQEINEDRKLKMYEIDRKQETDLAKTIINAQAKTKNPPVFTPRGVS